MHMYVLLSCIWNVMINMLDEVVYSVEMICTSSRWWEWYNNTINRKNEYHIDLNKKDNEPSGHWSMLNQQSLYQEFQYGMVNCIWKKSVWTDVKYCSRFIAFFWATVYVSEIVSDSCTENSVGHIGLPSTLYQGLPVEISANQINTAISPNQYIHYFSNN